MEIKIEVTEKEIAERKAIWIDQQLQQYWSQRNLKTIVQQFIFEKLDNLVQETLKDAIFTTQTDYQRQFEHHE